jgi:thiamine biosynthesis lipoprotein
VRSEQAVDGRRTPEARTITVTPNGDTVVEFGAMASVCKIRLAGVDPSVARGWIEQAVAEVRRIETTYSRYRADSIVSRINAAAGRDEPVALDAETADLIGFADQLWQASEGLFDITSGVLRRAWDFRSQRLPTQADLDALLPLIGWGDVVWSREAIALPRVGMQLDFGGFGKEYAADRAAGLLQALGARSGIVNLGGDLRVLGPQPDGSPWRMAIAHPREPGQVVASLPVLEGALATSGDYERSMVVDGRRYCHVLHPRSGWPVSHWQSVSVLAPACLAAGALTTIAMLKQEQALDFLRAQGVAHLAIDAHGAIHRFDGVDPTQ